jgi:predicted  nucleic acid-binding Zn-ribbon protein
MPSIHTVTTEVLRKLHRIHRQLSDLRLRLERGPKQIAARESNVAQQQELLTRLQGESKAFRVATDSKQLQFKSKEDKVRELRVKLNTATSNREYQALKDQIAADEMSNSVLADEILEAMEKADSLQTGIAEAAAVLAKAKEDTEKARQEIAQREPAIQGDVQRLEADLRECEALLPEDIRDTYHRLVRHRGEDALAPIEYAPRQEDQFCGGCNQQVPINMYNALTLNRPILCKSCGRMLYLPEGHEMPHAAVE